MVYMFTNRDKHYSQGFVITLAVLPAIISIIILLVGSNVARAFSLAGAFSIIRFRSNAGDAKDITYIFITLAAGLACGAGLIAYAMLFVVIISAFLILISLIGFGVPKNKVRILKITIPESLNYEEAFADIFSETTVKCELTKIKTSDLGSMFVLVYEVVTKPDVKDKDFIDMLRCRNGNCDIILSLAAEPKGEF